MAARKDQNGGSKPPPRAKKPIPREEPEESVDAGWFDDDEAKTKAKPAKASSRPAPAWENPSETSKTKKTPPAATNAKDKAGKTPATPTKIEKSAAEKQRIANAAKLLPAPTRRQTIEVQLDWLEIEAATTQARGKSILAETTGQTIPVEPEWLEDEEEEAPTIARGRKTPVSPPPIPKPPPLPREAKSDRAPEKRRPSAPPPRKR